MPNFKNIAFSRVIKANGRPREFNFRRKLRDNEFIYDVDVADERGDRHYISLYKKDGKWNVKESFMKSWIAEVLPQLPALIEEAEQMDHIS